MCSELVLSIALSSLNIGSDLTVRFNKSNTSSSPTTVTSWTFTIPASTAIDQIVESFISGTFEDGEIMSVDVLASDGQKDANGVATILMTWQ